MSARCSAQWRDYAEEWRRRVAVLAAIRAKALAADGAERAGWFAHAQRVSWAVQGRLGPDATRAALQAAAWALPPGAWR